MGERNKDTLRRQELIHALYSRKKSLKDHAVRIRFEIERGTEESIVGALTDYYINSTPEDYLQRTDLLKESLHKLSVDWLLLFFDYLKKDFTPTTPIPYNRWSVFTEDTQGVFDFISKTDDAVDRVDEE